MPTSYTSLLGFALPVTGELQGTWGTTVNDSITELVEDAIAATATASVTSGNWTLSTTGSGSANEARCAILIPTGTPGVSRNIIAPSQSKAYVVINQSDAAVVVKGSATTGTTIAAGDRAVVAWNGSDFITIASTATDGVATISFGTTGLTPSTATSGAVTVAGTLAVANGGTGLTSTPTNGQLDIGNGTGFTRAALTAGSGVTITNGSGSITISATGSGGDAVLANNNAFTGANTFYNSTGQTIGTGTSTQDGLILAGRAGGTLSYRITLQPATLSSSTTLTLPNVTDTVATIGTAQTFTAAQTFRAANAIRSEAASTQDAVVIAGRAGGTGGFAATITPTTLSANRTVTLPDSNTTIPVATQVLTFSGPTAARTYTLPDAASTLAALATTQTFTATQTFSGSTSVLAAVLTNAAEVATVSATAATGTINYDITTQSVLYYTSNASANWTVNFRASSGTSLNTAMSTGQSVTVAFLVTQGGTAYYNSAVQVDGSSVTPKWQGGTAPSSGNTSSIDVYSYTIVKTANATFTVFASQTRFA
jgi:hypothetical protein